ncbi:MAG: outer membrane lipoprotein LolB [Acidovorax sp.]|uniref:lipoprotein insertase outer membrane protein LolB n=1 Tax=Acidovorax sp. TaxID=1872122 RepID=UPI0025C30FD3|nr:lipoprotein insertase outer membrane protein LolB [Acidovorax sp.]MCE1194011.1 outer membrane lipoprotein LolB [Acidovorax sp.]
MTHTASHTNQTGARPWNGPGWQYARWLFWAVCALWLAGCAQAPLKPAGEENTWSGRLSLQVEGQNAQSFAALFELWGSERQGGLALTSPLGTRIAQVEWNEGYAQLTTAQETRRSDSLDALLQEVAGAPIPVAALFRWFQGQPASAPGWRADLSALEQGRLVAQRDEPAPQATLRIALTR